VDRLAALGDEAALESFLDGLTPTEMAHALAHLSEEQQQRILITLRPENAADIVAELPSDEQADLLGSLESESADFFERQAFLGVPVVDTDGVLVGVVKRHDVESAIALYQDTLSAVIALAVFLPIISDMSGCSGNQAVAVGIRELALGLVHPKEAMRV